MIATAKLQGHGASVLCLDVFSPSSQAQAQSSSSLSPPRTTPSTSALLLSGSEDGTARLWDLRDHRRRACLCIRVPSGGDVLSAVFSPPAVETAATSAMQAAATIRRESDAFSRDCSVYLGVENTVLEYDLRHADSPIICSEPTRDWGRVLQNQDEVNQIGLVYYNKNRNNSNNNSGTTKKKKNQKKKGGGNNNSNNKKRQQQSSAAEDTTTDGSLYLAACDDAGKARWTEAWSSSRESDEASTTILHHDNHGVAIVPACAFRPSSSMSSSSHKRGGGGGSGSGGTSLEFVTGGTDCKIQLWDIFRPKKPISTFAINQNTNDDGQSKPQVCNPPFVYSLAWSNDGKSLSAGLGDGTVGVFEINNRTLVQSQLLRGTEGADGTMHFAHESSVASVVYPSFSAPTSSRILCSAGSDGAIVFWDLGKPPNDEDWDDIIETVSNGKKNHNSDNDGDGDTNSDDAVAQLFPHGLLQNLRNSAPAGIFNNCTHTPTSSSHKPRILFNIPHSEKINWVTPAASSSRSASSAYSDTIFVADTSPDITSYTIPF